jgi:hypothetical protein
MSAEQFAEVLQRLSSLERKYDQLQYFLEQQYEAERTAARALEGELIAAELAKL